MEKEVGNIYVAGKQNLTVITTPPPDFWPKVRPNGLSTSASMVLDAPAVLALISSPLLLRPVLCPPLFVWGMENTPLASESESPWKLVFYTENEEGNKRKKRLISNNQ